MSLLPKQQQADRGAAKIKVNHTNCNVRELMEHPVFYFDHLSLSFSLLFISLVHMKAPGDARRSAAAWGDRTRRGVARGPRGDGLRGRPRPRVLRRGRPTRRRPGTGVGGGAPEIRA